jgi:hypothetical protein
MIAQSPRTRCDRLSARKLVIEEVQRRCSRGTAFRRIDEPLCFVQILDDFAVLEHARARRRHERVKHVLAVAGAICLSLFDEDIVKAAEASVSTKQPLAG